MKEKSGSFAATGSLTAAVVKEKDADKRAEKNQEKNIDHQDR